MTNRKNIKVSSRTFNRLETIQSNLEAICETKLSQDKVICIILSAKSLEDQIIDLMLETDHPSKTKKRRNQTDEKEEKKVSQNPREGTHGSR